MATRLHWLRALLAAAVCVGGIYVFAGYLEPSYPLRQWLTWRLAVIWGWCGLLNLAMFSCGSWLLARIVGAATLPPVETLVASLAVGIVGLGLLLYVAGFLGVLLTWVVVPLLLVLIAVGARAGWRSVQRVVVEAGELLPLRTPLQHLLFWATAAWAVWGLTFIYLGALSPNAINHDAAWYHLPIAADYARVGRIVPYRANYMCTLPHLMSVIYAGAFVLPGLEHPVLKWMLALHVEYSMVLWSLVGVAAGARWMLQGQRVRLLWAAFLLFPGIHIYDLNVGGSADHFLGVFAVPMFLATVRAAEGFALRRCLLLGILAAGAVLTKYQSLYLLAGSAALLLPRWLWLMLELRYPRLGRTTGVRLHVLLLGPVAIVLVGLLLTAPHFLKNVIFHGNPIYPFAQDVFTTSHPSHSASAEMVRGMLTDPGGLARGTFGEKLSTAVKAFFTFSFRSQYIRPGSVLVGSLFTLLLPLALLVRSPRRLWVGIASMFFAMLAWGMTQMTERYLQILTPMMAVIVAALLVRGWQLGWVARLGLVPLVAFQAVVGGDMVFTDSWWRIESAMELLRSGEQGRRDDRSRFTYRTSERALGESLPPDAVLLLHSTVKNLGMGHQVLTDAVGKQGLLDYDQVSDTRGLWELYRAKGITHVAHLPGMDVTFNRAHDVLFIDFVTNVAVNRRRFSPYEVAEVPVAPPPPHPDYRVLCVGTNYRDGLYRIEQMRVHENRLPVADRPPPPQVAWPAAEPAQLALLQQARAAVIGQRATLPTSTGNVLHQDFARAANYPERAAIWIRRRQ